MNYDGIENLTEEQVLQLYEDSVLLSAVLDKLYVECPDNGYRGYCQCCGTSGLQTIGRRVGETYITSDTAKYHESWFCCRSRVPVRVYFISSGYANCNVYTPYN